MGKMEIWHLRVPEDQMWEEMSGYLSCVSRERQEKTGRYRFRKDRMMSLFAELMLRAAVMDMTGLKNEAIRISAAEGGKPFLPDLPEIRFSLAHAGGRVALAVSRRPVGVDLECVKTCDMKLAERFFLPEEVAYIRNAEDRDRAFFYIWTRKEAYIKCTGEGLARSLKSFSVLTPDIRTFLVDPAYISVCGDPAEMEEAVLTQKECPEILCHF